MEAVKSFNGELSGLYEVKPPISKAKMTAITRGAIKAIKFYKHVVQSVEKFILKCKPEYKVPGLYVIDSIVRQSRHQFGAERDVFAPRFAKNMQQTFLNLFKCPPEDKSKVIRVLNLWQKNQVFPPEVIQPLFDLTDPNHPAYREQAAAAHSNGLTNPMVKGSPALQKSPAKLGSQGIHQIDAANHLGGVANNPGSLHADSNTLAQLQQLQKLLIRQGGDAVNKTEGQPVHFDRKLLDFDYDDDEDEDHTHSTPKSAPANNPAIETVGSLLSNPEVLRQLQTLQQSMQAQQHQEMDLEKLRKLQEMQQQEEEFDKHLAQTVPNLPFASECELKPPPMNNSPAVLTSFYHPGALDMSLPPPGYKAYDISSQQEDVTLESEVEFVGGNDNGDVEVINIDHADSPSPSPHHDRYSNRRRRSKSRDKSRDRGRDRDRRSRRSRSRSRSRSRRHRSRSRERDREKERERDKEREKEKERRKRGLPPIKKDNLSVCSTTLWVGHLSKLVHQEDLSDTFGEFGDVVSIDLIPPRGCAFIVMHRRQDASRCLTKLKNHKMQGKAITLAWAPGKGVKGKDLKDYWEVDLGVSYVPWLKLKPDIDIEMLEDGGMIDEDTLPDWLKNKLAQLPSKAIPPLPMLLHRTDLTENQNAGFVTLHENTIPTSSAATIDTSQPPPLPGAGILQPPPMTLPLVPPFQLNNRLLSHVGINLPPGMMPNVPIGVPPPNLPGAMMSNQLMGIGSPFGQGHPGLLQPALPQMSLPGADKMQASVSEANMGGLRDSLLNIPPPFGLMHQPPASMMVPHDDNMDIEMEDADKNDKQTLSDQLLASMTQYKSKEINLSAAVSRLHAVTNQRVNSGMNNDLLSDSDDHRDRRDDRDRNNSRSRDRDRDRNRDRDHRNSRDRNRDRDNRKDDRRDRSRWGDRDRKDHDRIDHDRIEHDRIEHDDRRDRSEKSVNDRLREISNESAFPLRERPRDRIDVQTSEVPLPLLDRPIYPPPQFPVDDVALDIERDLERDILEHDIIEQDRFRRGPPLDDFEPRMRHHPDGWLDHPDYEHRDRPDFDDARLPVHRDEVYGIDQERFMRRDRRDGFGDDIRMLDEYDHRMRSGAGSDFFPPRDSFGPRRPLMMRGPDGFAPRPMMGRPPGPHMFHPRGPPLRGPRPPGPPWLEGGMRPNFPPRYDGPPDFYRGPPGPPGIFDEPHHLHHRRHDDRRRFRPEFGSEENCEVDRPDKRSRWENSPRGGNEPYNDADNKDSKDVDIIPQNNEESRPLDEPLESNIEPSGNTTPLHDEPEEPITVGESTGTINEENIQTENKEQT